MQQWKHMTKIIFSVLFPLLQIYIVTVPLKVGCWKKKNILLYWFFFKIILCLPLLSLKREKPKFLRYLKLQNVSLNTVKLLFGNMLSSHYRDRVWDIQFPSLFYSWTFQAKRENNALTLRKANLYSTAISSITAIFSCVQNN